MTTLATLAHDATKQISAGWDSFYASAVPSGIVGDAAHRHRGGYHISIEDQPSSKNFSVVRVDDKAPPGNWPLNLAAAIDMSMSPADMAICSWRLWVVWNDKSDPRRQYINAFNGWFNDGGPAKRYDFVTQGISETTSDHKWHVHLEIRRRWVTSMVAAMAILSILKGESKQQYLAGLLNGGEEEVYAKYKMGMDGSPISHPTMYLQAGFLELIGNDPRLTDKQHPAYHPLTVDGKYGDNTRYWVSVLITGGEGDIMEGKDFFHLDRLLAAKRLAEHVSADPHGRLPSEVQLKIPATSIGIPETTVTVPIS